MNKIYFSKIIKFKTIRSKVSKIFTENQQMKIIIFLSSFYWYLRKYFLGVQIDYPTEFLNNWKFVKKDSSLDMERNFTLYQLIKMHNKIFENEETNMIEFGVSRGASLITIARFSKQNTNLFGVDSFGYYAKEIKEMSTSKFDSNYQGSKVAFNINTRFADFSPKILEDKIRNLNEFKNKYLSLIKCHFPNIISEKDKEAIYKREYSFVYLDFDLHLSTLDVLNFIFPRIKKKGIILIDDYNMINQEGCKVAIEEYGLDIERCIQTQSGQLVYFNF